MTDGSVPNITVPPGLATLADVPHAEGVAMAPDGSIWCGDEAGTIHRIDPDGAGSEPAGSVDGWSNGVCIDAAGRVYVCLWDRSSVVRFDPASGATETYCDSVGGRPLRGPNWPVFETDGGLLVSVSGTEDMAVADGIVIRVPPGGGDAEALDLRPLAFANGLALAPDGALFVAESFASRCSVVREGEVSVFAELPGTIPDGLALDVDGGLLVSCFQPNRIVRIAPDGGEPEVIADDWSGQQILTPTNVAFFGPDLRRLAIASLCGFRVASADVLRAGMALNYPVVP